jgi:hypothetical protein
MVSDNLWYILKYVFYLRLRFDVLGFGYESGPFSGMECSTARNSMNLAMVGAMGQWGNVK